MARERGVRYLHLYYEDDPANPKEPWREGDQPHECRHGGECWCEPKSVRIGSTVLVVHDPEDVLTILEDLNGRNPNQSGPNTSDPGG